MRRWDRSVWTSGRTSRPGWTGRRARRSPTPRATRRGYGPAAIKATGFTGTPVARTFAAVDDSIVMGAADVHDAAATGHGNLGYFPKA